MIKKNTQSKRKQKKVENKIKNKWKKKTEQNNEMIDLSLCWTKLWKLMNIIHQVFKVVFFFNKLKMERHMIISIDTGKEFNKSQYQFLIKKKLIKFSNKLAIEGN